jgi:hypothetical protein
MGSQGKLVKDAASVACYAGERARTQIQRRHAGPCAHVRDRGLKPPVV